MAIEKQLNTRIQLKYDSYANWNSNGGVVLKKGEIGICAVPSNSTAINGDNARPQILFKVGDGSSTFANLPWASAKAADVYDWAKQASLPVTKVGTGNVVAGIEWDAENKGIKFTTASVATSEGLEEVQTNLSTLTDKVNAMYTNAKIDELVADAKKAGTDAAADLASYKTTNNAAVAEAKKAGTDAAAALETYKGTNNQAISNINASIEDIVDGTTKVKNAENADKATSDANGNNIASTYETKAVVSAYKTSNDARVKAVEDDIAEITDESNGILAQAKAYAKDYADQKDSAMDLRVDALEAIKHEEFAKSADVVSNDTFDAFKTSNTAAITKAAGDAEAAAKAYADDLKDEILGEGIKDTFDTLVEIQTWIEGAGVNATELTEAIAAEAKTRGDEITRVEGLITAEATTARANEKANADNITKIIDGTTTVAKATHAVNADNATNAANATKASQDASGNVITSTYETKTDASSKLEAAKKYTDDQLSTLNTNQAATDDEQNEKIEALEGYFNANGIAKEAAKVSKTLTVKDVDGTSKTFNGSADLSLDFSSVATKAYADQAETDAIASAKAYTDAEITKIDTAYKAADAGLDTKISGVSGRVETLENNHVNTITAGTGLKATKGTNAYEIAFDDSVVFVFNCGSSTENV